MKSHHIEKLIQTAVTSKSEADYENLFTALSRAELYLNLSAEMEAGPLSTPVVRVGNEMRGFVLFVSKDNAKLRRPFGGIPWKHALEMLIHIPEADCVVIEGADPFWVAIDRGRAQYLMQRM